MKKIFGLLQPFDMYQTFSVYEDGNKIEIISVRVGDIPETILDLSRQYDTYQVDLFGAVDFAKGIKKQIQEKEMEKYSVNKLTINCI